MRVRLRFPSGLVSRSGKKELKKSIICRGWATIECMGFHKTKTENEIEILYISPCKITAPPNGIAPWYQAKLNIVFIAKKCSVKINITNITR